MVDFITDGDYDYCMLSQDLDKSTNKRKCRTSLGSVHNNTEESNCQQLLDDENDPQMNQYAEMKSFSMGVEHHHKLMIMIAWVRPDVKRLFKLYPHVIFVDATASTNKEKRPLFTFSAMDPKGHLHVFLRVLTPNGSIQITS